MEKLVGMILLGVWELGANKEDGDKVGVEEENSVD